MSAPVTSTVTKPSGERQRRRGERAEDGEQDQQHDREAGRLGLGEVLLGEVLHPGPQRALADEVGRDAVLRRRRSTSSASRRSTATAVASSSSTSACSGTTIACRRAAAGRSPVARGGGERDAVLDRPAAAPRRGRARRASCAGVAPACRDRAPRRAGALGAGEALRARASTAADCEPGTPKPPLERSSDWRAANGTAASRTTAQSAEDGALAAAQEARRGAASRIAWRGAPGHWLAGQPTILEMDGGGV